MKRSLLLLAPLLLLPSGESPAQEEVRRRRDGIAKQLAAPRRPGSFLVRFKPGAGPRAVEGGAQVRTLRGRAGFQVLRYPEGVDEAAVLDRLRRDPAVESADPDYVRRLSLVPNDTLFGQLWGLSNSGSGGGVADADIDATDAWDLTTGSASVVVAVLDSGVDFSHPELGQNAWVNPGETAGNSTDDDGNGYPDDVNGYDFRNNDPVPDDQNGHGTHVAGTIGAVGNNGAGVAGVCHTVRIMGLRFSDASGSGFDSDIVEAFQYAEDLKTRLVNPVNLVAINCSWGGPSVSGALETAMQACSTAGILLPCAAGNDALDNGVSPSFPANFNIPLLLSVGASTRSEQPASFSCFGATSVHLFAPGSQILSTTPGNNFASMGGTSMATPHVAGALALVAAQFPGDPPARLRDRILYNVDRPGAYDGLCISRGRLNVHRALTASDAVAPGAVTGLLAAAPSFSAVTISWVASGDDGGAGTATLYDLRYSTAPINGGNFSSATRSAEAPLPAAAGSPQELRLHALPQSGTAYYFAIRAIDELGNLSAIETFGPVSTLALGTSATLFSDDFPASSPLDAAKWSAQAPWDLMDAGGRPRVLTESPGGDYTNDLSAIVGSASFSLSGKRDAVLTFTHRFDIELGYDFGYVEGSGDDGTSWTRLRVYGGDSGGSINSYVQTGRIRLDPFDGQAQVRIRFRFTSDNVITGDGWRIDDVAVRAEVNANTAPVADDQSVVVTANVPFAITLTGSDANLDPLSYAVATPPASGALSGTPPALTYTPNPDYEGPDGFTFTVGDGFSTSAPASVTITVVPGTPVPAGGGGGGGRCGLLGAEVVALLGLAWALRRRRR